MRSVTISLLALLLTTHSGWAMNWISPAGFSDPEGKWTSESGAYDANTVSYAIDSSLRCGWGAWLELNYTNAVQSARLRVFADWWSAAVDGVDIDVYKDGVWYDVWQGAITDCVWTEKAFEAGLVSKIRFRYHYINQGYNFWLYEIALLEEPPPATAARVETLLPTGVETNRACVHGWIRGDGGAECSYRFRYGATTAYEQQTPWQSGGVAGCRFSAFLTNLTSQTTYHVQAQVRNDAGVVSGQDVVMVTCPPSVGWVSATGWSDSTGQWLDAGQGSNGETTDCARCYHDINAPLWGSYLYLTRPSTPCDGVRLMAKQGAYVDQVDVDVLKNGVWVDLYQGAFTNKQWLSLDVTVGTVTQARVRFHVSDANCGLYWELYDFAFRHAPPAGEGASVLIAQAEDAEALLLELGNPEVDPLTIWFTGFEPSEEYALGALNDQNGWIASNSVEVVGVSVSPGEQAVFLPGTASTNAPPQELYGYYVVPEDCTHVWTTFAWCSEQGLPALPALAIGTAVVCMDHARLIAWDGSNNLWRSSAQQFVPDTLGWWRLDVSMDYVTATYSGYVNGVLALEDVPFNNATLPTLVRFAVRGAAAVAPRDAFVDNISIAFAPPTDLDDDGDGLSNLQETALGTDLRQIDSDGDGLNDAWEVAQDTDPLLEDADMDPDGDGLSNFWEAQYGTNPQNLDTDDDGLTDGYEVAVSITSPLLTDTDGDDLDDWWEVRFGLDPLTLNAGALDPDVDTLVNSTEAAWRCNPLAIDTDGDALPDAWEIVHGLNPASGESVHLVSAWRFDEASGSVAVDDNRIWGNDANLVGTAARAGQGHAGGALQLDGGNGYASVVNHPSLASTNGMTLALRVCPDSFATPSDPVYLVAKGDATGALAYAVSYLAASNILCFSHQNTAGESETRSVACTLPLAAWTHLAVTVNGADVSFFTNGAPCGMSQSLAYTRTQVGALILGSTPNPAAVHPTLCGRLDDVRVYDAPLDPATMSQFMEGEADADGDGLSNRLECDSGTDPHQDDRLIDSDGDGLSNADEILIYGTHYEVNDTDGDGANDGVEVAAGTNPLLADWDMQGGPTVTIISPAQGAIVLW